MLQFDEDTGTNLFRCEKIAQESHLIGHKMYDSTNKCLKVQEEHLIEFRNKMEKYITKRKSVLDRLYERASKCKISNQRDEPITCLAKVKKNQKARKLSKIVYQILRVHFFRQIEREANVEIKKSLPYLDSEIESMSKNILLTSYKNCEMKTAHLKDLNTTMKNNITQCLNDIKKEKVIEVEKVILMVVEKLKNSSNDASDQVQKYFEDIKIRRSSLNSQLKDFNTTVSMYF